MRTRALPASFFACSAALLAVAAVLGLAIGTTPLSWTTVLGVLATRIFPIVDGFGETEEFIVWSIRLPRVLVGMLSGGSLALAGAAMQGLFRNPLADPGVIGTSAAAACGAVAVFVTGLAAHSALWLPLASFVGAFGAALLVYSLATRGGVTPVATLVLAGIACGSFFSATTSLLISISFVDWQVAAEVMFWLMGGLDSRAWVHVWIALPFTLAACGLLLACSRDLDLLSLGEESAQSLGLDVERTKQLVLLGASLATAASVAVSGILAFVGLVVPHIVRLILGPTHRLVLPASMLAGAGFLVACDILARVIHPPGEVRLGIVTAAFGAPFFLWLLRARRNELGAA